MTFHHGWDGSFTVGDPTLTRTTSGLIVADAFTRADGELCDGVLWVGAATSGFQIASHVATDTNITGVSKFARYVDAITPAVEMVVQASLRSGAVAVRASAGVTLVDPANVGTARWRWQLKSATGPANGTLQLIKTVAGVDTVIVTVNTVPVDGATFYTGKLWVKNSQQRAYLNGTLEASGSDVAMNGVTKIPGIGRDVGGGVSAGASTSFDDWCAYLGNTVVVTGLPTGWKAVIGALSATESSGTATIALDGTPCPIATALTLTDASDVVQATYSATSLWGGDVFAYATPTMTQVRRWALATALQVLEPAVLGGGPWTPAVGGLAVWRGEVDVMLDYADAQQAAVINRLVTPSPQLVSGTVTLRDDSTLAWTGSATVLSAAFVDRQDDVVTYRLQLAGDSALTPIT